jgi:hypothetical protein
MPNIGHHCHQSTNDYKGNSGRESEGKKKIDFVVFGGESVIKSERISN